MIQAAGLATIVTMAIMKLPPNFIFINGIFADECNASDVSGNVRWRTPMSDGVGYVSGVTPTRLNLPLRRSEPTGAHVKLLGAAIQRIANIVAVLAHYGIMIKTTGFFRMTFIQRPKK